MLATSLRRQFSTGRNLSPRLLLVGLIILAVPMLLNTLWSGSIIGIGPRWNPIWDLAVLGTDVLLTLAGVLSYTISLRFFDEGSPEISNRIWRLSGRVVASIAWADSFFLLIVSGLLFLSTLVKAYRPIATEELLLYVLAVLLVLLRSGLQLILGCLIFSNANRI